MAAQPEPLPGTVKLYHRHLVVCTGPVDWPEKIESGGGFLQTLAGQLAQRSPAIPGPVKMTACDEPSSGPGYDILLFPDKIRYQHVQEADIPVLVEEQLVKQQPAQAISHHPLIGSHIFVCIHGRRDIRCGECGPPLFAAFESALAAHLLTDSVTLRGSSHVGGHKFAGNVLIYPGGDWYGYVAPQDVARLVEQHLVQGQIVKDLWRGRMGLTQAEQLALIDSQSS